MLANGTEYHHALEEDATPTGWCKLIPILQVDVAQMGMVPL